MTGHMRAGMGHRTHSHRSTIEDYSFLTDSFVNHSSRLRTLVMSLVFTVFLPVADLTPSSHVQTVSSSFLSDNMYSLYLSFYLLFDTMKIKTQNGFDTDSGSRCFHNHHFIMTLFTLSLITGPPGPGLPVGDKSDRTGPGFYMCDYYHR